MAVAEITLDDLLAALQEAGCAERDLDGGKTTREYEELWGCGKTKVLRLLDMAKRAGVLRRGKRAIERLDGVGSVVPVYFIELPQSKPKKGRTK